MVDPEHCPQDRGQSSLTVTSKTSPGGWSENSQSLPGTESQSSKLSPANRAASAKARLSSVHGFVVPVEVAVVTDEVLDSGVVTVHLANDPSRNATSAPLTKGIASEHVPGFPLTVTSIVCAVASKFWTEISLFGSNSSNAAWSIAVATILSDDPSTSSPLRLHTITGVASLRLLSTLAERHARSSWLSRAACPTQDGCPAGTMSRSLDVHSNWGTRGVVVWDVVVGPAVVVGLVDADVVVGVVVVGVVVSEVVVVAVVLVVLVPVVVGVGNMHVPNVPPRM